MKFLSTIFLFIVISLTNVLANNEQISNLIPGNSYKLILEQFNEDWEYIFKKDGELLIIVNNPVEDYSYEMSQQWRLNNNRVIVTYVEKKFLSSEEKEYFISFDFEKGYIIFDNTPYTISRVNGQSFASFKDKYISKRGETNQVANINKLKSDCKEMGFSENTEAMGNCILKLMEISKSSASTNNSGLDSAAIEQQRITNEILKKQLDLEKKKAKQKELEYYSEQFQKGYDMLYPDPPEDNSFSCYTTGNYTRCD